MPRNKHFTHLRERLFSDAPLELDNSVITGPFSFMNPTRARFNSTFQPVRSDFPEASKTSSTSDEERPAESDQPKKDEQLAEAAAFQWRSRDNRKGRHALQVKPAPADDPESAKYITPAFTNTFEGIMKGIRKMFTYFPYWDVSWWVAILFTIGSLVWCINGFFAWLPLVRPSSKFPTEVEDGGGITAFIGATIFEIGSIFLMLEAVNENRTGCFGWALERTFTEEGTESPRKRLVVGECSHHHSNHANLVGKGGHLWKGHKHNPKGHFVSEDPSASPNGSTSEGDGEDGHPRSWLWWPSWEDLKGHYLHEIGFMACLFQLIGATIFWMAGWTSLPGLINTKNIPLTDGIYWSPQVIGGTGFIISSWLFMLETQKAWYKPAFGLLGWHMGFWNLVGAIGFTLCGALGYSSKSGVLYQAALSTFWGSWAFLIGSCIQWYESLDKHPVELMKDSDNSADSQGPSK